MTLTITYVFTGFYPGFQSGIVMQAKWGSRQHPPQKMFGCFHIKFMYSASFCDDFIYREPPRGVISRLDKALVFFKVR